MTNGNKEENPKLSEDEWKKTLTPKQFKVLREKDTDAPFTGKYTYTRDKGIYKCAACGNPLFLSKNKFDSECGWPSFDDAVKSDNIKIRPDYSHGMVRDEVICAKCESHLGHIFDDGPKETTGKRFCINSTSLNLEKN